MTEQMAIEHAREFIKYMNHENWEKDFDAIQILINATEEIQQYRAIGTVEELQALKEKSEAKKPLRATLNRDMACHCPTCMEFVCFRDMSKPNYCSACGTKIDWE